MSVFCTLMKNGSDYLVENQQFDGPNWKRYGTLAANMPGVTGYVFVANMNEKLACFDGKTFVSIEHFEKSASKVR